MSIYRGLATGLEQKGLMHSMIGTQQDQTQMTDGGTTSGGVDEASLRLFEDTQQRTSSILIYTILIGVISVSLFILLVNLVIWSLGT